MATKKQDGFLSKQQKKHARRRRAKDNAIAKQSKGDATLGTIQKEHRQVIAQKNALIKIHRDTKWHHSVTQDGARMDSGIMALLLIPLAISASMVSAVQVQVSKMSAQLVAQSALATKYHSVINTAMSMTQQTQETQEMPDDTSIATQMTAFTAQHEQ